MSEILKNSFPLFSSYCKSQSCRQEKNKKSLKSENGQNWKMSTTFGLTISPIIQTFKECEFDYVLGPSLRLRSRKSKIKGRERDHSQFLMTHIPDKNKLLIHDVCNSFNSERGNCILKWIWYAHCTVHWIHFSLKIGIKWIWIKHCNKMKNSVRGWGLYVRTHVKNLF